MRMKTEEVTCVSLCLMKRDCVNGGSNLNEEKEDEDFSELKLKYVLQCVRRGCEEMGRKTRENIRKHGSQKTIGRWRLHTPPIDGPCCI